LIEFYHLFSEEFLPNFGVSYSLGPNVSTTPITAMGCQQCLPLSVVHLKGKHCRKPHCRNGVVDTFGPEQANEAKRKKNQPNVVVIANSSTCIT
jgi:hypothetical protein